MTAQFHALVLGVLMFLYCTLNLSGNPISKSQVELHQANVGVLSASSSAHPQVWEIVIKPGPDIMMVVCRCPVLLEVHVLISMQLMNGRHDGYFAALRASN
jgi:hypothetical protein